MNLMSHRMTETARTGINTISYMDRAVHESKSSFSLINANFKTEHTISEDKIVDALSTVHLRNSTKRLKALQTGNYKSLMAMSAMQRDDSSQGSKERDLMSYENRQSAMIKDTFRQGNIFNESRGFNDN
jgi:hypothetical protein